MASTRIVISLVVTAASALVAVAACSGSSTGTTSGDGGASSGASGTSGASGGNSKIKTCPGSSSSKCTEAELTAYGNCFTTNCDAEYTKCYGADYKNGNFSGACGTYLTCTQACACGDAACLQKCAPSEECTTCSKGFATCASKCTAPACASGSSGTSGGTSGTSGTSGGAGKTCADLSACCGKITNATIKTNCQSTYDAAKASGDASCNAVYSAYATYCP